MSHPDCPANAVLANDLLVGIRGMSCTNCSRAIEKALAGEPGIIQAKVFLADESAEIRFNPEQITPEAILKKIVSTGYDTRILGAPLEEDIQWLQVLFTALLALPVFGLAMFAADVWANRFTQMVLSGIILMTTGKRFFSGAVRSIKSRVYNMDVLVALGVGASWSYSALIMMAPSLGHGGMIHFEAAAILVLFILSGKTLESLARQKAVASLKNLTSLQQGNVRRLKSGETEVLTPEEVQPGDLLNILPGERFLLDGTIAYGSSSVDESLLTGEPIPASKSPGMTVFSGTVNLSGELIVRVSKSGSESTLQSIIRAVRRAQADKPQIQRFADQASDIFVPVVIGLAALTFAGWMIATGTFHLALMHAVTVLVVACPCALGLATPMAIVVAGGIAMNRGLLVKKTSALEALAGVKYLLTDKTGTLTEGKPTVHHVEMLGRSHGLETMIAALGSKSLHPLSRAIVAHFSGIDQPGEVALQEVEERQGFGIAAKRHPGAVHLALGSLGFMEDLGIFFPPLPEKCVREALTPVYFACDFEPAAIIGLSDHPRPEAARMISDLADRQVAVIMVSGDRQAPAQAVARMLGILDIRAEVLPAGKLAIVQEFLQKGPTAFFGDGMNDAPALSAATVGLAIGSGADAAREATDLVLVGTNLGLIPFAIDLSRATLRKIRQNLLWAIAYNLIMLPMASGILIPVLGPQWVISPMLAGLAMALSSVSVVINSLFLHLGFPASRPARPN